LLSELVSPEQLCAWNVINRVVDDAPLEYMPRHGPDAGFVTTKTFWRLQTTEGSTAREKLCDRSMPLFETRDAMSGVQGCPEAVAAAVPSPRRPSKTDSRRPASRGSRRLA
jgi:hypothetical protein